MRTCVMLVLFCSGWLTIHAQRTLVQGCVKDSTTKAGLPFAMVSLLRTTDSTLVAFARADSAGCFKLRAVSAGSYLFTACYVGYAAHWQQLTVPANQPLLTVPEITLIGGGSLQAVTVTAKRPPVVMNKDTLEFNTENFSTPPNAVVEDMLKKMPGVTVESDGTIKVNGQTVKKILVNGKEFFTGDPTMATKNLPADAIDKVQVYNKKSDQAEFTGIDDGNEQKTLNLKLKKDRDHALFGKLTAGAGNKNRFDAQGNINRFNGKEQLSFLGMGNNTNRQGFSVTDALNFSGELTKGLKNGGGLVIRTDAQQNSNGLPVAGRGQQQQGVATTYAGGVNYNNNWNEQKTDLNGSYTGNHIRLLTNTESLSQNITPGSDFTKNTTSHSEKENSQHRLNFALDQRLDSFTSLKFTPALTTQHTVNNNSSSYTSRNGDGNKLNEGFSSGNSAADAFDFSGNLLLRKKLRKPGRTLSANLSMGYNHSTSAGRQYAENTFYQPGGTAADSVIDQVNSIDANTRNIGLNVSYTEPLGRRGLLEFNGFINNNAGASVKTTYTNNGSGKYDVFDQRLSNDFSSNYLYSGGGVNFRANWSSVSFTAGGSLQAASLKGTNHSYKQNMHQAFTDVLPSLVFQYNMNRTQWLRLNYAGSTIQPSMLQLQPVEDISDPLNITKGNPSLKRQYNHTVNLNYTHINPAAGRNMLVFANLVYGTAAIVSADSIRADGVRTSMPVNVNGTYNLQGFLNYSLPVAKGKSRIDLSGNFSYNHGISLLNGMENKVNTRVIGPGLGYSFSLDSCMDVQLSARVSYNHASYSLQPQLNSNYVQQTYTVTHTQYLPLGLVLNNQFSYIVNSGYAQGYNSAIPLWNVSVGWSFLANKRGELKLSVFDLLNKNTGINRSINQSYFTDQRYNVLNRYCLLSFTYSLNKGIAKGRPQVFIRELGQ